MIRCEKCGVFVSSMRKHLDRKRCKRVKERREERGEKQLPRGQRNGQKIKKKGDDDEVS